VSPDELDAALEELENRLERLRALYDQYFLGIEKIEPSIARKDVDRRVWLLRQQQIRNTARRFRLQTLVMRYNTFQQYWQRICRDIENGTYTRHMLRAERTVGEAEGMTIAARKRLGMFRRGAEKRAEREERRSGTDDAPVDAPVTDNGSSPEDFPPEPGSGLEQSAAIPRPKLDNLDLDMDFFDTPPARPAAPPAQGPLPAARVVEVTGPPAPAASSPVAAPPRPAAPPRAAVPPAAAPPPVAATAQRSPALPPVAPAASRAGLLSRLGPTPARREPPPRAAPPPSAESRRATPPPATAAGLSRPAADRAARLSPGSQRPPPPEHSAVAPVPKLPLPPRVPAAPTAPAAATNPGPAAAKNPGPAAKTVNRAAKSAPHAPATPAAPVSDERIRELHGRLIDAKRQVKDGGKVSVDGLAKSLRAAESRLRQQHGNRRIDFDVVIKDGKAVVKPILR
jgi:hypothetical protein